MNRCELKRSQGSGKLDAAFPSLEPGEPTLVSSDLYDHHYWLKIAAVIRKTF